MRDWERFLNREGRNEAAIFRGKQPPAADDDAKGPSIKYVRSRTYMVGFVAADAVRTDMGTWSTHCGRPQSEDWRPVKFHIIIAFTCFHSSLAFDFIVDLVC